MGSLRVRGRLVIVPLLVLLVQLQQAFGSGIIYQRGDVVPLFANKVGPFANPSEQYEYYTLPFCAPKDEERKNQHLGEVLAGDRMMKTLFSLPFLVPFEGKKLCSYSLKPSDIEAFQRAIDEEYYFEFIYDDLPIWGFIGEKEVQRKNGEERTNYYLFTHYIFSVTHNGKKVLEASWEHDPDSRLDITDATSDTPVQFRYTSKWIKSDLEGRHLIPTVAPQHLEIRWFSIFNSIVTVLLLTGFLFTILMRVLKNDFLRYARSEDEEQVTEAEESGWKLIHGDVFRYPNNKEVFCAILGNGAQLLCLCIGLLFLACLGVYSHYNRGAMFVAALLIFALTSGVNGYVTGSMYAKLEGGNWVWSLLLSYFLFLGPFFLMGTFLNFVAVAYNSSTALPFGTVIVILLILTLVSFPLNVIGGISGRNFSTPLDAPCRTTKIPREIPPVPWHRQGPCQVIMAGFLPFSAIYIELYYVFASVWGHQLYSLYGILMLVFLILIIVTSFITIALTYFQVAIEDHHWWWRSIFSGGCTGIFIFGYCIYYFKFKAKMSGFMQTSFFFGYMGMVCYGAWLMLGTVGFFSSLQFVKYIYRSIKCD
uniref:Transmembrane 9 superfamily member n=1 Tax=Cryptomonas curvata TaxID=233186 RepID=A0A7S0N4S3_9CRYP|mmetsp:Transcript_60589/g.126847  ORF Transcript_60589/g.126847 Transcript_60589/m.126847 type:complete len:592 (+) Transcript_60589:10-1785(+)